MILNSGRWIAGAVFGAALLLSGAQAHAKSLTPRQIRQQVDAHHRVLREIEVWDPPLSASDPLSQYSREYEAGLPTQSPVAARFSALQSALASSRYVFIGDIHSASRSQENAVRVMKAMAQSDRSQPLTLVIEWIDAKFQPVIDDYLAGKKTLEQVRSDAEYDKHWSFSWDAYSRILSAARELGVHVLAGETAREGHPLAERDVEIATTVETHRSRNPGSRYLVMYGENHLSGKQHLSERLAERGLSPYLVILQKLESSAYWQALTRLKDPEKMAVLRLSENYFFLDSGSPLVADYQYLRYLARMAGDEPRIIELGRALMLGQVRRCSWKQVLKSLPRGVAK